MLFKDKYFFLSNFYPAPVTLTINNKTLAFKNSEAGYQAQKNFELAKHFCLLSGSEAKKLGQTITITTPNWDDYKLYAMADVLNSKFQDYALLFQLKLIKEDIIEDNYWGDTFWGVCTNKTYDHEGKNMLGKLLMCIRDTNNNKDALYRYIQTELLKNEL